MTAAIDRVKALSLWREPVEPQQLVGGITNLSFVVTHAGERFVVRLGDDIPVHQVMRFNERAASEAAFRAGLSPELVHAEPGVQVIRFIEGRTLKAEDVREPARLARIVALVRKVHDDMPRVVRGPALIFWVFHVIRDYAHTLKEGGSRNTPRLPAILAINRELEQTLGATEIVYGHNDLLPGNFIDDGERIWLIDWDYAGFNTPLFDLANLSSNAELTPDQERFVLETYYGRPPDAALMRRLAAMKCASALRESMWGMVSEIHSKIEADFAGYAAEYWSRFERSLADFRRM